MEVEQSSTINAGIPTYYGDNKLLLTVCHHSTKPEGFQGHSLKLAHMILMQARTRVRTHSHEGVYTHSLCKTLWREYKSI